MLFRSRKVGLVPVRRSQPGRSIKRKLPQILRSRSTIVTTNDMQHGSKSDKSKRKLSSPGSIRQSRKGMTVVRESSHRKSIRNGWKVPSRTVKRKNRTVEQQNVTNVVESSGIHITGLTKCLVTSGTSDGGDSGGPYYNLDFFGDYSFIGVHRAITN